MLYAATLWSKCERGIKIFSDTQSFKKFSSHVQWNTLEDSLHQIERVKLKKEMVWDPGKEKEFPGDSKGKF